MGWPFVRNVRTNGRCELKTPQLLEPIDNQESAMRAMSFAMAAILLAATGQVQAATLNFDTDFGGNALTHLTPLNTAYPLPELTFSSNAVIRASGGGVPSQPNFAGSNDFMSPIVVTFSAGFVGNSIGAQNVSFSNWTLTAYDDGNNLLGSASSLSFPGGASTLSFAGLIRSARFTSSTPGADFGIDNLTFDASRVGSPTVPEPTSLALAGFAGIGMAVRAIRRRRQPAAAA